MPRNDTAARVPGYKGNKEGAMSIKTELNELNYFISSLERINIPEKEAKEVLNYMKKLFSEELGEYPN